MQILERITTPTRSFTIWDGEGFIGQGVKTRTWEDRVKELESIGASREDAEEVINAQDIVNRGTQYETFAFAMQWHRGQKLQDAINKMHKNIARKEPTMQIILTAIVLLNLGAFILLGGRK